MQTNFSGYELDVVRTRQDEAVRELKAIRTAKGILAELPSAGGGLRLQERLDRVLLRVSQGAWARQVARQQREL